MAFNAGRESTTAMMRLRDVEEDWEGDDEEDWEWRSGVKVGWTIGVSVVGNDNDDNDCMAVVRKPQAIKLMAT